MTCTLSDVNSESNGLFTTASIGQSYRDRMPLRRQTDQELRARIVAWTRYLARIHQIPSGNALARRLGVAEPTVAQILAGTRTPGLDFVVRLHRTFHQSADVLIDSDPPKS